MPRLFETTRIKSMVMANRLVRSATWTGLATPHGSCTAALTRAMLELVEGGAGLVITGHAYIHRNGKAGPAQLGIYSEDLVPGLRELTSAVHDKGGVIALQIAHAGLHADTHLTGLQAIAPSIPKGETGSKNLRKMGPKDIKAVVRGFAASARRAREAGFDAVQIHAAHGYLLSQFLSPYYNRRKDQYGGMLDNRVRIVTEVLDAVRAEVGEDYPVLVKLNSEDFLEGCTRDEMLKTAVVLQEEEVDAMEISGGTMDSDDLGPVRQGTLEFEEDEAYYLDAATWFRANLSIPLMLVGGIRSYRVAEALVEQNIVDYVCVARPLIREPDLFRRWREGDRRRAACVSCSRCFMPVSHREGLRCVSKDEEKVPFWDRV